MADSFRILVISDYRETHSVRPEAHLFISLARLGHHVEIMTYAESEFCVAFAEAGIKVHHFHPVKKWNKAEIQHIRDTLKQGQFDIVHLYNSISIVNGLQAAKGLDVKVILYRGFAGNIAWYSPYSYLKFLHPRVDMIVCNSRGVEDYIQSQSIFRSTPTITINKGHKLEWYSSIPAKPRSEFGFKETDFLICCVANNRRMKGVPYLLQSLKHLEGLKHRKIHLLLMGRDMDTKENIAILNRDNSKDMVHFMGFQTDVLSMVKACDLFVLPSIFGESITKSVIESMSLGTPAVITDIPGNLELVEHQISGWVVPSKNPTAIAEAITQVYENPAILHALGRGAQAHIKGQLSHQRTVEKHQDLYLKLMHESME